MADEKYTTGPAQQDGPEPRRIVAVCGPARAGWCWLVLGGAGWC